jgi:hypothetical protein
MANDKEWKKKFKGDPRGGAHIHTHPALSRAIVVNHNGVNYDGNRFPDLETAKRSALAGTATRMPDVAHP